MSDSGAPELPPGAENDDRGPSLVIFSCFMIGISVVAISLRLISRGLVQRGQRFWWDDWVALFSLPWILALMGTILGMVHHGLGRRLAFVAEEDLTEFLRILFIGYFVYDIGLAVTKCSALLFFSRVFPRRQTPTWFNWALYTIHALNAAWLVGIIFGTVFICRPVSKNWIPTLPGQCGAPSGLWIGSAVPSAFIDLLILLLPLPQIWSLQLTRAKRFGIIAVFMLGYGVVVVSLGRLVTTFLQAPALDRDITYEMPPILFWVGAEAPITLLSICLPAMLPLFRQIASKIMPQRFKPYSAGSGYAVQGSSLRSRTGNFRSTMSNAQGGVQMRNFKASNGEDDSIRSDRSWKGILPVETTSRVLAGPGIDVPERGIKVERDVFIDRQV